jgi:hypothetical protein
LLLGGVPIWDGGLAWLRNSLCLTEISWPQ